MLLGEAGLWTLVARTRISPPGARSRHQQGRLPQVAQQLHRQLLAPRGAVPTNNRADDPVALNKMFTKARGNTTASSNGSPHRHTFRSPARTRPQGHTPLSSARFSLARHRADALAQQVRSQDLEAAARRHHGLQVRKPVHNQVSGPRREQARLMRPHVRERPRCTAQAMLPLFVLRAVLRAVQAQP